MSETITHNKFTLTVTKKRPITRGNFRGLTFFKAVDDDGSEHKLYTFSKNGKGPYYTKSLVPKDKRAEANAAFDAAKAADKAATTAKKEAKKTAKAKKPAKKAAELKAEEAPVEAKAS